MVGVLILVVFVISAALLCLVVLIQDDQGDAMGGLFGGGGSSTPFGARTGNVLTRMTTVLAGVFFLSAFALAWLNRTPEAGDVIRRARLESLEGIQSGEWWIESTPTGASDLPAPPADAEDTPSPSEASPPAEAGSVGEGSTE